MGGIATKINSPTHFFHDNINARWSPTFALKRKFNVRRRYYRILLAFTPLSQHIRPKFHLHIPRFGIRSFYAKRGEQRVHTHVVRPAGRQFILRHSRQTHLGISFEIISLFCTKDSNYSFDVRKMSCANNGAREIFFCITKLTFLTCNSVAIYKKNLVTLDCVDFESIFL